VGGDAALIGLDWGTSSLRAYLMGASGAVIADERRPWGIMQLPGPPVHMVDTHAKAGFERAFDDVCGAWLQRQPGLAVIACGMVGSAQGWKEATYLDSPVALDQLATQLTCVERVAGGNIHIVPGLIQRGALPDVMRGEETQVLGALAAMPQAGPLLIGLPGTHSKWVSAVAGSITQFTSYMTGEVFAALRQHTILGRTMQTPAQPDDAAFLRGLQVPLSVSAQAQAGLLSQIFSTRTLGLTGDLPATAQADYLSGLLIGHEVAALAGQYRAHRQTVLCGEPDLCRRYGVALQTAGFSAPKILLNATARGLWQVAGAAGLLGPAAT
jgi:2-dehydro-3-deoxygalactonokinase